MDKALDISAQYVWSRPIASESDVAQVLAALTPYAIRIAIRNEPTPGEELQSERVRDRLIECLGHRLHAIFNASWDHKEAPNLLPNELPMITGGSATIITLANVLQGWPSKRMVSFHEKAKAGTILRNVDLELTVCWLLAERMGASDNLSAFRLVVDPSNLNGLISQLTTPEHASRNQAVVLQEGTQQAPELSVSPRPRRAL